MNNIPLKRRYISTLLALSITGLLLSAPAYADRDENGRRGNNNQQQRAEGRQNDRGDRQAGEHQQRNFQRDSQRDSQHDSQRHYQNNHQRNGGHHDNDTRVNIYFGDQHRAYIHDYYQERYYAGRCPPGLAKRHNGCVPYGQERRWRRGYALPHDVIYYDLPPSLIIQLGAPPPRHRYVRVAGDILLIAIGTGLVVDALEDLNY